MKRAILTRLKEGCTVSGEVLAAELGVSRTSIWKYVKKLRLEGYRISSSPRRGYALTAVPDRLLADEIASGLETRTVGRNIVLFEMLSSTQNHAKKLAYQGSADGTLVVAERQTDGRGRLGRFWASPPGGLYFSLILRPPVDIVDACRIPLVAGVALLRAIGRHTTLRPRLKWPNDVLVNDRKTAGILAEMSAEVDRLDWIVLGVGINVNTPPSEFPEDIREKAGSLAGNNGAAVSGVKLLQDSLRELEQALDTFGSDGFEPFRRQWKDQNCTMEQRVTVTGGKEAIEGRAVDIDSDGALVLECDDGIRRRIFTGDVSFAEATEGAFPKNRRPDRPARA